MAAKKKINVKYSTHLVEIRPDKKEAVFQNLNDKSCTTEKVIIFNIIRICLTFKFENLDQV